MFKTLPKGDKVTDRVRRLLSKKCNQETPGNAQHGATIITHHCADDSVSTKRTAKAKS